MPTYRQNNGHIWTYKGTSTLDQANPVQNTWYTILDTTTNVRIYCIAVNVEDTNETIEVQITIDGETITGNTAATHSTNYFVSLFPSAIWGSLDANLSTTLYAPGARYTDLVGKSIKIEVRKTTAAGVGNLMGIVAYAVLEAI